MTAILSVVQLIAWTENASLVRESLLSKQDLEVEIEAIEDVGQVHQTNVGTAIRQVTGLPSAVREDEVLVEIVIDVKAVASNVAVEVTNNVIAEADKADQEV
mmetsp:Transcript_13366/g.9437  ORF Transcript_13366/g.9437 Transcript_13366/m.9437 type:complete len:102 (-) Transcript_13366:342-647(-)